MVSPCEVSLFVAPRGGRGEKTMNWTLATMLGLSLSMDAFAVSCAIPLCRVRLTRRDALRVAGCFGLFQGLMPLLGWILAARFADLLRPLDHWVAFGLLLFVGGKMVREGRGKKEDCPVGEGDPTRGRLLLLLALGTSIDALAVGVSFLGMPVRVLPTAGVIGGITFLVCLGGLLASGRFFRGQSGRFEVLGGVVLVGIGLKILLDHLCRGI